MTEMMSGVENPGEAPSCDQVAGPWSRCPAPVPRSREATARGLAGVFRRWAAPAPVGEAEVLGLLLPGVSSRRGPGAVVLGVPASPE